MDLERQADRSAAKLNFVEKFITRLGDARQWEFTGEVLDGGSPAKDECICGHLIRWIFVIQKTGSTSDRAHVGSECINHFQDCNPVMYAALLKAQEELTERMKADKKAKQLAADEAAQLQVHAKWVELRHLGHVIVRVAQEYADAWSRGWISNTTYVLKGYTREDKQFKTVKGRTKWLEKQTGALERAIADMEKTHPSFVETAREKVRVSATGDKA